MALLAVMGLGTGRYLSSPFRKFAYVFFRLPA
jgi:hypothetical protein